MAVATSSSSVSEYLSHKQSSSDKAIAAEWAQLEEYYNKKLWHQLTLKLERFVKNPELCKGENLVQVYQNFITSFENKINPLSLVEILAIVVQQIADKREAISFLEKLAEKVKNNTEAHALCQVLRGQIALEHLEDYVTTKQIITSLKDTLEDSGSVTSVHGRYYQLAAQYYRVQAQHGDYYRAALRYLGCIDISELSAEEQHKQAYFLGLAALLGDGVYNLGELLAHPILQSLKDTENSWMIDLLNAFNRGDIAVYENMRPKWTKITDLVVNEIALRQKISLLCLMEMTFKRAANNRQLKFEDIAMETRLPVDEVEFLVMKALAQGLVKGAIDQVAGVVNMTWVQPRVLDRTQIGGMAMNLENWCTQVEAMENLIEVKASEILTL
ncbi:26S proteasome non-ATPase regulatory subunit 13-like [Ctenocephalides felis]|uniref:26S proteasome non-ATPase regulatory subunit 13-like n=1 Tax=Ctenocephalides felis TaxID=7515 RepID=UPI000E6E3491|nr:26S proteasome non-ATPase regulatory subunit 13-like [Ctenocephalides felis]XP_026480607.1 26S proteasome non-ATPase regulatory subunit 13-like [Ctenocephalides felis]